MPLIRAYVVVVEFLVFAPPHPAPSRYRVHMDLLPGMRVHLDWEGIGEYGDEETIGLWCNILETPRTSSTTTTSRSCSASSSNADGDGTSAEQVQVLVH
ncbi:unnamed protein product [Phytophthora fragariaefolia]|uniref:Unnamed protein product n=1 Tax=Phytophthora fragariaefolia TaxID=1490495 RepID=A0A9W6XZS9_9STRA|nr:unnamed protein product [Phytophthora fragariaefolia]